MNDINFFCYLGIYNKAIPAFCYFFNKYWDKDIDVDIISHQTVDIDSKFKNFKSINYEVDCYATTIMKHLDSTKPEITCMLGEDMPPIDYVDENIFNCLKIFEQDKSIDRIQFQNFFNIFEKAGLCSNKYIRHYNDDWFFVKDIDNRVAPSFHKANTLYRHCELITKVCSKSTPHTFESYFFEELSVKALRPYTPLYKTTNLVGNDNRKDAGKYESWKSYQYTNDGFRKEDIEFLKKQGL